MKTIITILILFLASCSIPFGTTCDAEELAPYSEEILEGCNKKCCMWILLDFETGIRCDEMWCFKDCSWDIMHETCYQT